MAVVTHCFMSMSYAANCQERTLYRVNSKERHELRYQRRREKRLKRKQELNKLYGDYDKAISVTELVKAYNICKRNVGWKSSVQRYGFNLLKNSLKLHKMLQEEKDTFKGFYQFEIFERGKRRKIRSIHISERCIEKSLAVNSFVPMMKNSLIYDNSASLKGRGTDYARKRILKHLRKWYHFHKDNGYVIVGDFTSFFDNIDHGVLLGIIQNHFNDERYSDFAGRSISHYGPKGLGLGSELNQIFAISLPDELDHYIKNVLGCKYYHRYNDDFYIIVETKEEAHRILDEIRVITKQLGITLSERKTYITKVTKGFTFLKKRYILTSSGKIVTKHCRRNITYERRKLHKFRKMLDRGELDYKTIQQQYMSWRGYLKHTPATSKHYSKRFKNEYKTIMSMDKLFNELFIKQMKEENDVYSYQSQQGSH